MWTGPARNLRTAPDQQGPVRSPASPEERRRRLRHLLARSRPSRPPDPEPVPAGLLVLPIPWLLVAAGPARWAARPAPSSGQRPGLRQEPMAARGQLVDPRLPTLEAGRKQGRYGRSPEPPRAQDLRNRSAGRSCRAEAMGLNQHRDCPGPAQGTTFQLEGLQEPDPPRRSWHQLGRRRVPQEPQEPQEPPRHSLLEPRLQQGCSMFLPEGRRRRVSSLSPSRLLMEPQAKPASWSARARTKRRSRRSQGSSPRCLRAEGEA